jgi:hypothetical protein
VGGRLASGDGATNRSGAVRGLGVEAELTERRTAPGASVGLAATLISSIDMSLPMFPIAMILPRCPK